MRRCSSVPGRMSNASRSRAGSRDSDDFDRVSDTADIEYVRKSRMIDRLEFSPHRISESRLTEGDNDSRASDDDYQGDLSTPCNRIPEECVPVTEGKTGRGPKVGICSMDFAPGTKFWSEGSALHEKGECKPCAFFHRPDEGCRDGEGCQYCHICPEGEIKRRKRLKQQCKKAEAYKAAKNMTVKQLMFLCREQAKWQGRHLPNPTIPVQRRWSHMQHPQMQGYPSPMDPSGYQMFPQHMMHRPSLQFPETRRSYNDFDDEGRMASPFESPQVRNHSLDDLQQRFSQMGLETPTSVHNQRYSFVEHQQKFDFHQPQAQIPQARESVMSYATGRNSINIGVPEHTPFGTPHVDNAFPSFANNCQPDVAPMQHQTHSVGSTTDNTFGSTTDMSLSTGSSVGPPPLQTVDGRPSTVQQSQDPNMRASVTLDLHSLNNLIKTSSGGNCQLVCQPNPTHDNAQNVVLGIESLGEA